VPGVEILMVAFVPSEVPPLLQAYPMPPVAAREMALLVQDSIVVFGLAVMAALGAAIFCVMVVDAFELHPLEPVTVTV
jgi:hypothetical protein